MGCLRQPFQSSARPPITSFSSLARIRNGLEYKSFFGSLAASRTCPSERTR